MKNPFKESDLIAIVQGTIANVLGCSTDEAGTEVAIVNELNADSLDFVELRFNLEKQLGIMLPRKSVLDHLVACIGDESEVCTNGRITELAVYTLRQSCFNFTEEQVHAGMQPYDILGITTVRNWACLCKGILDQLPERCGDCGHEVAQISPAGRPVCASCGAPQKPLSGDDTISASIPEILATWQEANAECACSA